MSRNNNAASSEIPSEKVDAVTSREQSFTEEIFEENDDSIMSRVSVDPASRSETIGFWLLGLTTYFGYNVIVSAAHDLIATYFNVRTPSPYSINTHNVSLYDHPKKYKRDCNEKSTGTFMLINIVPQLIAQLIATFSPFYCLHIRMLFIVCLLCLGIVTCALSTTSYALYIGVGCTSFSTGIAESTIISYISTFDNKHLVLTLSSGSGSAGLLGSLWYVVLVAVGFSSSTIFYTLIIIPFLMAIAFFIILDRSMFFCFEPPVLPRSRTSSIVLYDIRKKKGFFEYLQHAKDNFCLNISYIPRLYPFIISGFLVYFFEYYINQCLHELIYFKNFTLTHNQQYQWYQVSYNFAVFLVKSSLYFITVRSLWWLPLMQGINAVFLTFVAIYFLLPHFTLVLCFIFWEGLMGGFTYTTIFCVLYTMVDHERRKFSMAFVSIAETLGITCAALVAQPAHSFICSLPEALSVWLFY